MGLYGNVFFLLLLVDFVISYGLCPSILNMIWFLLFIAKMLIITTQGGKKTLSYL